jgi:hypothetical protein
MVFGAIVPTLSIHFGGNTKTTHPYKSSNVVFIGFKMSGEAGRSSQSIWPTPQRNPTKSRQMPVICDVALPLGKVALPLSRTTENQYWVNLSRLMTA